MDHHRSAFIAAGGIAKLFQNPRKRTRPIEFAAVNSPAVEEAGRLSVATPSARGVPAFREIDAMNEMLKAEDLVIVACDLTPEQRKQALVIAAGLERDMTEVLAVTFAAADELKIEPHVVATGISLHALMLAASLHAGNDNSFCRMASQALALCRTGREVQ
jgi:hypothetical protein